MAGVEMPKSSLDNSFETKMKKDHEEKTLAPVVTKDAIVTTKPSLGRKFTSAFISEDMRDVGDYILLDIIIPGIKNAIIDTLERIFFNGPSSDRRRSDRKRDSGRYGRTSYESFYRSSSRRDSRDNDDNKRRDASVDYRNIVLSRREDAEEIVRQLRDYIEDYDSVSVARLLDLINEPGKYTDNNYGWTRPQDICVRQVRNGYLIDVTEAEYLGD